MEADANPINHQPQMTVTELDAGFKDEVAAQAGMAHLDLTYCFQCGVCSGSCPTAERMEYGPRRILQMIRLGLSDTVLRSHDIWICVSCYSCAARCPQNVQVPNIMAALRNLAITRGLAKDREATFSRAFMSVLQRYGRMYEPELLLRYYTAEVGPAALLKQAGIGLAMFRKGKIALRPERIENSDELGEICMRLRGRGGDEC